MISALLAHPVAAAWLLIGVCLGSCLEITDPDGDLDKLPVWARRPALAMALLVYILMWPLVLLVASRGDR